MGAMSREQIVEVYLQGGMSRRTFVRRMVAAGLTVSAAITYAELLQPSEARADLGQDLYATDKDLPPDVQTTAVTNITPTSATLHATVDPNFRTLNVRWNWGTAIDALSTVTSLATIEGWRETDGSGARDVSAPITGLTPATRYYVQASGQGINGSDVGDIVTFMTLNADGTSAEPNPTPTPAPTATPTPTPAPAATATPLPPTPPRIPDVTPPTVTLAVLTRKRRTLLSSGLTVTVGINEPGSVAVRILDARKRQLSRATSGLVSLPNGGTATLTVKLTAKAKARIRLGGPLRWTVEALAADATGNQRTAVTEYKLG